VHFGLHKACVPATRVSPVTYAAACTPQERLACCGMLSKKTSINTVMETRRVSRWHWGSHNVIWTLSQRYFVPQRPREPGWFQTCLSLGQAGPLGSLNDTEVVEGTGESWESIFRTPLSAQRFTKRWLDSGVLKVNRTLTSSPHVPWTVLGNRPGDSCCSRIQFHKQCGL
jgi:hypothetical protein